MRLALNSENHGAPSGPITIPSGDTPGGNTYSVIDPEPVIRPMASPLLFGEPQRAVRGGRDTDRTRNLCVNHRLLSGPTVMPVGARPAGSGNSLIVALIRVGAGGGGVDVCGCVPAGVALAQAARISVSDAPAPRPRLTASR